jgi:hypothetical protein
LIKLDNSIPPTTIPIINIDPAKEYFKDQGKVEIKIKKIMGKNNEITKVLNVDVNPFLKRKKAKNKDNNNIIKNERS